MRRLKLKFHIAHRSSLIAHRSSLIAHRSSLIARRSSLVAMLTLYGIKNCDTMKKARAWLDAHGVAHTFHDYKASGVERAKLAQWCKQVGWEALLNRAGTTFRKLSDEDKSGLDERKAIALMLAQPSMIKRPVLERGLELHVGFRPDLYEQLFTVREQRPAPRCRAPS